MIILHIYRANLKAYRYGELRTYIGRSRSTYGILHLLHRTDILQIILIGICSTGCGEAIQGTIAYLLLQINIVFVLVYPLGKHIGKKTIRVRSDDICICITLNLGVLNRLGIALLIYDLLVCSLLHGNARHSINDVEVATSHSNSLGKNSVAIGVEDEH